MFLRSHPLIATVSGTETPFCPSLCGTLQRVLCSAPGCCTANKAHENGWIATGRGCILGCIALCSGDARSCSDPTCVALSSLC